MNSDEMIKLASDTPGILFKTAALASEFKPAINLGEKMIAWGKNLVKGPAKAGAPTFMEGARNTLGRASQATGSFVQRNLGNPAQGWKNFGSASKRIAIGGGAAYVGYKGLSEMGKEVTSSPYNLTLRNRMDAGIMDPSQVPEQKMNELYGGQPQ